MSIPRPDYPSCFLCLSLLYCPACKDSEGADLDAGAGTSTSGASTAPDAPTTGAGGGGPPLTTTTSTGSTGNTGDDPDTSTSGADITTGGLSGCGDGVVDANEECDEGVSINDDNRFCKSNCTLNICGDGNLFVGWELCDDGLANSDDYGSLCGSQCVPGARCGDHKLQAEFESCDLGQDNGGAKGDEQEILCDASCRALQLRGFVTKDTFNGDLGGVFGADLKCRSAAAAAGLAEPERFYAFLSTGDIDAKERFKDVSASLPYVLVTGKKFADNFMALIDAGPLGDGIMVTETGSALYEAYVATNTAPGGLHFNPDQHCQGWTSANPAFDARIGLNAVAAPEWSEWKKVQAWIGITNQDCDNEDFHLYCLEI